MRAQWWALALLAGACPEPKARAVALRVPLPDGWVARAAPSGALEAGPKGRVVLTLDRRTGALPAVDALSAAVEEAGGAVVASSATGEAVRIRYTKGDAIGLLVVRPLEGGALLLCASAPAATPDELDASEALCGQVGLEPR